MAILGYEDEGIEGVGNPVRKRAGHLQGHLAYLCFGMKWG
jgi:hypothetical protein